MNLDKAKKTLPLWKLIITSIVFLCLGIYLGMTLKGEGQKPLKTLEKKAKPEEYQNLNPFQVVRNYRTNSMSIIEDLETDLNLQIEQLKKEKKLEHISVYFRDLSNGNSIKINELEIFSPASLMKVPIMIAVFKLAEENPTILNQEIEFKGIQENQYNSGRKIVGNSTVLITGMRYPLHKLMEIMIDESDNEATILLLDFLDAFNPEFLNQVQLDLGLEVPDSAVYAEDFITVKKYSSFFRTLYNASYLNEEYSNLALEILKKSGYGFGIRQAIPIDVPIAHKFGHKVINDNLQELHHFGLVYLPRKPFLIGIMTKGKNLEDLKYAVYTITDLIYKKASSVVENEGTYRSRDLN